jgi:hypothetical protein
MGKNPLSLRDISPTSLSLRYICPKGERILFSSWDFLPIVLRLARICNPCRRIFMVIGICW